MYCCFVYHIFLSVLETKVGPSVRDRQLLVRTSNFLYISLQIDVWISQNFAQDPQFVSLALNTASYGLILYYVL